MRLTHRLIPTLACVLAGCIIPTLQSGTQTVCVGDAATFTATGAQRVRVTALSGTGATEGGAVAVLLEDDDVPGEVGDEGSEQAVLVTCVAPGSYRIAVDRNRGGELVSSTVDCVVCDGSDACAELRSQAEAWRANVLTELGAGTVVVASDGVSEGASSGNTDAVCVASGMVDAPAPDARETPMSCDDDAVTCASGALPLFGEVAAIAVQLDGDVTVTDAEQAYQYGFVFETDGDAANDWTGIAAYPNDTYKGTDTWVQYTAPIGGAWTVGVDDVTSGQQIVRRTTSDARVVREGSILTMFIPLDELGDAPRFRVTAFRHDGRFLQGEWNIDYHPDTSTLAALPVE